MGGQIIDYEALRILKKGEARGDANGQQKLAATIKSLKSGTSESALLASGIKQETIDLAKSCL